MSNLCGCHNPSLGLATKAKACKGVGQEGCERMWGWKLTLPSELPFWELESRWTPELLESNCKGQNTSHWGVLYIVEKILKCRCLKWACMTHWTSATQVMAKRKVANQTNNLIPDYEKSRIDPTSVHVGGMQHTVGKLSTRATTLL
jgi:hypothetical protein